MSMRVPATIFALLASGLLAWGLKSGLTAQTAAAQAPKERMPVVVELFTSEGCSSCPPADKLLSELDARQPLNTAEVIAIEEHVDYWDQDGWKDPFSSADWTARQNQYTGVLKTGSSYTPEMVVDGKEGFVGSRTGTAVEEIQKAAAMMKTKVQLGDVQILQNKSVTIKINVEKPVDATPKDTPEVILVITENDLHSSVKAGENNGKELQHSPVLRELKVIGATGKNGGEGFSAQASVKLDSAWKLENLRAIVFVQEKRSRRILGASAVRLTQQSVASR
ncbi:MAG TPA: DUF1223 domain-containing protein [Candidatus Acidoferrum sp.]|nr:DUF1223 domain-containing protein [Candidatus Acidoferrum sp.]